VHGSSRAASASAAGRLRADAALERAPIDRRLPPLVHIELTSFPHHCRRDATRAHDPAVMRAVDRRGSPARSRGCAELRDRRAADSFQTMRQALEHAHLDPT